MWSIEILKNIKYSEYLKQFKKKYYKMKIFSHNWLKILGQSNKYYMYYQVPNTETELDILPYIKLSKLIRMGLWIVENSSICNFLFYTRFRCCIWQCWCFCVFKCRYAYFFINTSSSRPDLLSAFFTAADQSWWQVWYIRPIPRTSQREQIRLVDRSAWTNQTCGQVLYQTRSIRQASRKYKKKSLHLAIR